jgi:hypothetical protein
MSKPLTPLEQQVVNAIKKAIERAGSFFDASTVEFFFADIDEAHGKWDEESHSYDL